MLRQREPINNKKRGQEVNRCRNKIAERTDRAIGNSKQAQTVHTATNSCLFSLSLQQKIQKKFECRLRREGLRERNTDKEQVREKAGKPLNYTC